MPDVEIKPNQSCVPGDLQGQAGWFENWNAQMQIVGASLGYATGELDRIKDDNTIVQFLASSSVSVEGYRGAMTSHRRGLLTGANGSTTPDYPSAFSGIVVPATSSPVTSGIWDRLNSDIGRVRGMPIFTEETGALLGINPTSPAAPDAASVHPGISLSAAMHNYHFAAVVSGREQADQWQVWIKVSGAGDWQLAATATGKSTDVTFDPGEAAGPVALEVFIQLRRNNADYGQPSDIALVTVNP